jgi:hypothetical protein
MSQVLLSIDHIEEIFKHLSAQQLISMKKISKLWSPIISNLLTIHHQKCMIRVMFYSSVISKIIEKEDEARNNYDIRFMNSKFKSFNNSLYSKYTDLEIDFSPDQTSDFNTQLDEAPNQLDEAPNQLDKDWDIQHDEADNQQDEDLDIQQDQNQQDEDLDSEQHDNHDQINQTLDCTQVFDCTEYYEYPYDLNDYYEHDLKCALCQSKIFIPVMFSYVSTWKDQRSNCRDYGQAYDIMCFKCSLTNLETKVDAENQWLNETMMENTKKILTGLRSSQLFDQEK